MQSFVSVALSMVHGLGSATLCRSANWESQRVCNSWWLPHYLMELGNIFLLCRSYEMRLFLCRYITLTTPHQPLSPVTVWCSCPAQYWSGSLSWRVGCWLAHLHRPLSSYRRLKLALVNSMSTWFKVWSPRWRSVWVSVSELEFESAQAKDLSSTRGITL